MKTLINIAVKFSGLSWVVEKVNGYKTYLGGSALILIGVAQILQQVMVCKTPADYFALIQTITSNPAYAEIAAGIAAMGIKHSQAKMEEKVVGVEPPK